MARYAHSGRRIATTAFHVLLLLVFATATPILVHATTDSPHTEIIVRAYVSEDALIENFRPAAQVVTSIFERAGIRIVWLFCNVTREGSSERPCAAPAEANQLIVRILSAPEGWLRDSLGFTNVGKTGSAVVLCTVFAD